jgi:hypothetical protein
VTIPKTTPPRRGAKFATFAKSILEAPVFEIFANIVVEPSAVTRIEAPGQ